MNRCTHDRAIIILFFIATEIYYQCPKGWRLRPPYCYEFGTETMSWDAAEAYCVSMYGHLASIHDADEASFASGKVKILYDPFRSVSPAISELFLTLDPYTGSNMKVK